MTVVLVLGDDAQRAPKKNEEKLETPNRQVPSWRPEPPRRRYSAPIRGAVPQPHLATVATPSRHQPQPYSLSLFNECKLQPSSSDGFCPCLAALR